MKNRLRKSGAQWPGRQRCFSQRVEELNLEWTLGTTASSFTISGILLGALLNKRWLILPGMVGSLLLQHYLQGWCPPLSVFRFLNFGTRKEIDREKY
jgi:hypothetical protein